MGTRCLIGIENADSTVTCIEIHYDGYFGHIIPILRTHYMTRESVEQLIRHGDNSVLLLPSELEDCPPVDVEHEPMVLNHKYKLEELRAFVPYCYLFTKNNEWECQLSDFMKITDLNF
jgi:hypothetical protein